MSKQPSASGAWLTLHDTARRPTPGPPQGLPHASPACAYADPEPSRMAHFELQNFEAAKSAFEAGKAEGSVGAKLRMWVRKCNAELELQSGAVPKAPVAANPAKPVSSVPQAAAPARAAASRGDGKVRHEWYQNKTHVILTIFGKNTKQEDVSLGMALAATAAVVFHRLCEVSVP